MSVRSEGSKASGKASTKGLGQSSKGQSTGNALASKNLIDAVIASDAKGVEACIKAGANVNNQDEHGWTALRKAARAGDLNMVSLLLENGADVTMSDQVVILTAASWGRADVLKQLLEGKGNVGPETEWDITPLIAAAENGHSRVMKVLLEYGADVNQEDKSGNDALMAAWDSNRAGVVLFLVERGANLKKASDWVRLAASPVTAAQIAEGINRRNLRRIAEAEFAGNATVETYTPGIKVPLEALCQWIELVPKAAVTFLDKVLLKTPKDAPERADMGATSIRTQYININEWAPKEEPLLLVLAPKDQGNASVVSALVLHQNGVICEKLLFSLARADKGMFKSFAVQALLRHCWTSQSAPRFFVDAVLEFFTIVSLVLWVFVHDNGQGHQWTMILALVMLTVDIFVDLFDEMRQISYFREAGVFQDYYRDWTSSTGASINRYSRVVFSILTILFAAVVQPWNTEFHEKKDDYTGRALFDVCLSITVFVRWLTALNFFRGYEFSGPSIIPIINALRFIGPFVLCAAVMLVCYYHLGIVLKDLDHYDYWQIFLMQWRLLFLRDFDLATYTDGHYHWLQMIVFLVASFMVSVGLLNIFIAVVIESFDFQQELSLNNFMQQRNHLCLKYFLCMEGGLMGPVDYVFQKIIPGIFGKLPENAFLWVCHIVDEEDTSNRHNAVMKTTIGRVGWIKKTVREALTESFKQADEDILDAEQNLKKRWTQVSKELKALRTETQKKFKALATHLQTEAKEGHMDKSSASELDAVEEGGGSAAGSEKSDK